MKWNFKDWSREQIGYGIYIKGALDDSPTMPDVIYYIMQEIKALEKEITELKEWTKKSAK
jgi:hypothetical protein